MKRKGFNCVKYYRLYKGQKINTLGGYIEILAFNDGGLVEINMWEVNDEDVYECIMKNEYMSKSDIERYIYEYTGTWYRVVQD